MYDSMNLPNILALFRIVLCPLMLYFLIVNPNDHLFFQTWHSSWFNYFAGLIFVIACMTDFLDGLVARSWNQVTKLGSIIDPLADKMLVLAAFIGLLVSDRVDPFAVLLILSREFFVTGLRILAVGENMNIAASQSGKIKTVLQMIAIGFLIMQWPFATILLWVSVIITLYSGYEYFRAYLQQGNI